MTLVFCAFLGLFYVGVLWFFAQIAGPNKGNAELVTLNQQIIGAANVGQSFSMPYYFWGRPSYAGQGYDAANSSGSNKGPTNEYYLKEMEGRIQSFLTQHPYLTRDQIPAEMVTASASGLDPDISPECARIQVKRVAQARGWTELDVWRIVEQHIEMPLFGWFGTPKVNVLKLNAALDQVSEK